VSFTQDGKLLLVNGTRASLAQEFPTLDLEAVCRKAAPDVRKIKYPDATDALLTIRKHCQYELDYQNKAPAGKSLGKSPASGPPANQLLKSLSPEQRARYEENMKRGKPDA
jgi:hypothetical protein